MASKNRRPGEHVCARSAPKNQVEEGYWNSAKLGDPLTRPAPAEENAWCGASPQGRGPGISMLVRALQPAGDGLLGEGERGADGAEGLGFILE